VVIAYNQVVSPVATMVLPVEVLPQTLAQVMVSLPLSRKVASLPKRLPLVAVVVAANLEVHHHNQVS
jgi:hypothetical protein